MRYKNIRTGEEAMLVYISERWVFLGERGRFFVEATEASIWQKL